MKTMTGMTATTMGCGPFYPAIRTPDGRVIPVEGYSAFRFDDEDQAAEIAESVIARIERFASSEVLRTGTGS